MFCRRYATFAPIIISRQNKNAVICESSGSFGRLVTHLSLFYFAYFPNFKPKIFFGFVGSCWMLRRRRKALAAIIIALQSKTGFVSIQMVSWKLVGIGAQCFLPSLFRVRVNFTALIRKDFSIRRKFLEVSVANSNAPRPHYFMWK